MLRVLGAVIAGGASRRMGGAEKAFMLLDGIPLVERVLSRLDFQVGEVVINVNGDAARFAGFGRRMVADRLLELHTPLAGLDAVLVDGQERGFDAVLTVPVDSPFLPLDLAARLAEAGAQTGAAIATSGGQPHYLTGLWSTAMVPELQALIAAHKFSRMKDLGYYFEVETAAWPMTPHDPFMNINTLADLAAAEAVLHA